MQDKKAKIHASFDPPGLQGGLTMEMNWISVEDELPKNLDDVLIHHADGRIEVGCRYSDGWLMERGWGPVTPLDAAALALMGGEDHE